MVENAEGNRQKPIVLLKKYIFTCMIIIINNGGTCGSDIGAYRGTNKLVSYPRIIGHEIAGEVISIPEDSRGIVAGDRVVLDPYKYCGDCYPCSIGRTNCCENLKVLGVHTDGGMAEYFCHPAEMLVKVPDTMDWKYIPMAEPLTIALHAVHRTNLQAGEHIGVIGAGTIGLLTALVALDYGAVPIVLDIVQERLDMAKEMGVPYVINTLTDPVEERIREFTNGKNAPVVVEASGANESILRMLDIVSFAGRIALTGWPKSATMFPTDVITRKELDVKGSRNSAGEFEEAIELIQSGRVPVEKVLTQIVTLEDAPETIRDIERNPGAYLKVNVMM